MSQIYTSTVTTPAAVGTVSHRGRPFISLMSDFGSRDPSAGIMRAVVMGICPEADIVDLTHDVDKFAIRDGALLLWSAVPYLPIGVQVAVIDPGVGTERKGIAVETSRGDILVGPDNGLLMPAAARLGGIRRAHLLENPRYALSPVSSSFHGRDIFAPAAAHLADRVSITELGRAVDPRVLVELDWPRPEIRPGYLSSHAIYVDTFGNVKLSALAADVASALPALQVGERLVVRIGDGTGVRELPAVWATTFGSVPEGAPLVTTDSYGRISLAVHQGSAARRYEVGVDEPVAISRPRTPSPPRGTPPERAPATPPARPMPASGPRR